MPQSWPSQWTILFILFTLSFFIIMILTYFVSGGKKISSSIVSHEVPSFNWQW